MPFYETLNNRETSGRDFLKIFDTMTKEGDWANSYDFMDSDGVDKSIKSQTIRLISLALPYFIPYVGEVYGLSMATTISGDALAKFGKAGIDVFSDETDPAKKSKTWKKLNKIDSFSRGWDKSVSDEGAASTFSSEQLINIVGDTFTQLAQQRAIASIGEFATMAKTNNLRKAFLAENSEIYLAKYGVSLEKALSTNTIDAAFSSAYLTKLSTIAEKTQSIANKASKIYMTATQVAPMYDTFKENGFNAETTAIGLLGAVAGFELLYRTRFGEVALGKLTHSDGKALINKNFNLFADDIVSIIAKNEDKTVNGVKNMIFSAGKSFKNTIVKTIKDNPEGFFSRMSVEAVEEFSEELIQDLAINTADALNAAGRYLGFKNTEKTKYNYLESNPMSRYGMAFLGGFAGGAIFKGAEDFKSYLKNGTIQKLHENLPKDFRTELVESISKLGGDYVVKNLDDRIKKGKIASTTLSMELAADGKSFLPTNDIENSQNAIIGNHLKNYIRSIESVIQNEGYAFNKDELINKAVAKEVVLRGLVDSKTHIKIANDFKNGLNNFINAKIALDSSSDENNKIKLTEDFTESKRILDTLINGERSVEYAEMMAFNLNRSISNGFTFSDVYAFALTKGKQYATLNSEEKEQLDSE